MIYCAIKRWKTIGLRRRNGSTWSSGRRASDCGDRTPLRDSPVRSVGTPMTSPVGIGRIYWDASKAGIRYVLWIAILVNVNLAIFNLLPIPVLDGGHITLAIVEAIRRKHHTSTLEDVFVKLTGKGLAS